MYMNSTAVPPGIRGDYARMVGAPGGRRPQALFFVSQQNEACPGPGLLPACGALCFGEAVKGTCAPCARASAPRDVERGGKVGVF